jgi:hypothetical protein
VRELRRIFLPKRKYSETGENCRYNKELMICPVHQVSVWE